MKFIGRRLKTNDDVKLKIFQSEIQVSALLRIHNHYTTASVCVCVCVCERERERERIPTVGNGRQCTEVGGAATILQACTRYH